MELILATHNVHKISEFREMLKAFPKLDLLSLHQFSHFKPLQETGTSFQENATLKAEYAAKFLNKWVLADDSGLVVPSLKGKPGIFSSRYACEDATDSENRQKLLNEMKEMRGLERCAYYECCLVLASPEGVKKCVTAISEGKILSEERGRHGFGYDSIFVKNDYDKTFAELGEIKNRISHRRKALEKIMMLLEMLL